MNTPIFYKDSLLARAAPLKYRRIGNPYAFLNGVGIESILDEVRKGHNLVEIAEEIDISIGILLNWIENEGHVARIEDAFKFSAEGYLAQAARAIKAAATEFDLKKAKELASHGRFMASKMDRGKYGAEAVKGSTGNTVNFVLHMGGEQRTIQASIIEGEVTRTQQPEILSDGNVFAMFPTPQGVAEPDSIGPFVEEPWEPTQQNLPAYLKETA
jgi:hypothetical protein